MARPPDTIGSSAQVQAELVDPVGVIAWLRDFLTRHPLTMRCFRQLACGIPPYIMVDCIVVHHLMVRCT